MKIKTAIERQHKQRKKIRNVGHGKDRYSDALAESMIWRATLLATVVYLVVFLLLAALTLLSARTLLFFIWCTGGDERSFRAENLIGKTKPSAKMCMRSWCDTEYNIEATLENGSCICCICCMCIHTPYVHCKTTIVYYALEMVCVHMPLCWPSCLSYHSDLLSFFPVHISIWHTKHGVQYIYSSSISCTNR